MLRFSFGQVNLILFAVLIISTYAFTQSLLINENFEDWEGEIPITWKPTDTVVTLSDEKLGDAPVLRIEGGSERWVFCQFPEGVAQQVRSGDILGFEVMVKNPSAQKVELYVSLESTKGEEREWNSFTQAVPVSAEWQKVSLMWQLDDSLFKDDEILTRTVCGIRYTRGAEATPLEISKPRFWLHNLGL